MKEIIMFLYIGFILQSVLLGYQFYKIINHQILKNGDKLIYKTIGINNLVSLALYISFIKIKNVKYSLIIHAIVSFLIAFHMMKYLTIYTFDILRAILL